jgi:hypothetical protein
MFWQSLFSAPSSYLLGIEQNAAMGDGDGDWASDSPGKQLLGPQRLFRAIFCLSA